jgi:hypothetical protein
LQIITTRPSRAEPGQARQTFKNAMIQRHPRRGGRSSKGRGKSKKFGWSESDSTPQ